MSTDEIINWVLVVGVIVGGIGYAVGQFTSQKRRGQSDALDIALKEIEALRIRAERQEDDMRKMHLEVTKLRAENESLRSLLTGGTFLAEQLRVLIAEEVEKGAHVVVGMLRNQ